MPDEVSTWGANTRSGWSRRMVATTSSIGAGAKGDFDPAPAWRAFSTWVWAGIAPISKIWLQR